MDPHTSFVGIYVRSGYYFDVFKRHKLGHMSAVKTKAEELKETIAELGLEPYLEALDEQGYTAVSYTHLRAHET